jgi:potassium-transporting ATPase KdpC subunit
MKTQLRPALVVFAALTLITGVVYPLLVTGIAQSLFSHQAHGSVVLRDGAAVGSELIGQTFDAPRYFWGRPSATGPVPYNAAASTGSNLGPTNPAQLEIVRQRVERLRQAHPDQQGAVPADLATASASGLDPHISPASAHYQAARVAAARRLSVDDMRRLIDAHTAGRTFGMLGEPRVNVLRLNLALDSLSADSTEPAP